jgi:hypothetical protein
MDLFKIGLGLGYQMIRPFLTRKKIQQLLKQIRVKSNRTITFLILPKGKTFISEFLQSSNIHTNLLIVDYDDVNNVILKGDFEFNKLVNVLSNNKNDLLLPILYKNILKLKMDFNEKSIVIVSSNINLAEYTSKRIPSEVNVFIPSPKYYSILSNNLDDETKKQFFNDYNTIILSQHKYNIYVSLEDCREQIKTLFL